MTARDHQHTLLGIDLGLSVQVETQDQDVGQDVQGTDTHQDLRILKGNLLGQLHHHEDDAKVGTVKNRLLVDMDRKDMIMHPEHRENIHLSGDHFAESRTCKPGVEWEEKR
jgi:hypothetical protein